MGVFKRRYPDGTKSKDWYIDFYYNGKRIKRKIGPNKRDAELALKNVKVKEARKEHLGIYEERKIYFRDYVEEYLQFSERHKEPTTYSRDKFITNNLSETFGDTILSQISINQVEAYKQGRIQKVKGTTVNREMDVLRHMMNHAVSLGYIKENPIKGFKRFRTPPGRLRCLTTEEIEQLIKACSEHLRPIVITAVNTGMRREEILSLKWKDVRFHERIIVVNKSKNNERRIIYINESLYEELTRIFHDRSEYVFCDKRGQRFHEVKKSFHTALKTAKIKDFRLHDLRHTFASHLVMNGVDIRAVQDLMGHKDIRMTMRHSHLSSKHLQNAVSTLDAMKIPEMKVKREQNGNIEEKGKTQSPISD